MKIRPFLTGMLSYTPLYGLMKREISGTDSALYCYSVWLRHLVVAHESGLNTELESVAELGPGASLGTGLAALLSGASNYYALDVVKHSNVEKNLVVYDGLVDLFRRREPIPNGGQFRDIKPDLESYDFPAHIFAETHLDACLSPERVQKIREAIVSPERSSFSDNSNPILIKYFSSWYDTSILKKESVDMIFSQAVLEHVEGPERVYEALYLWLKPGGYMSHQIDFRSHGTAGQWNGHWAYNDLAWKLVKGKKSYLINREPHSRHVELLKQQGFRLVRDILVEDSSGIGREQLSDRFKHLTNDDLVTSGAHMISVKPNKPV